jgi:hypothetical protein
LTEGKPRITSINGVAFATDAPDRLGPQALAELQELGCSVGRPRWRWTMPPEPSGLLSRVLPRTLNQGLPLRISGVLAPLVSPTGGEATHRGQLTDMRSEVFLCRSTPAAPSGHTPAPSHRPSCYLRP